ncbi:MAG TPA: hypothetical protein VGF74_19995 [Thermoleophilaceae bacterium]
MSMLARVAEWLVEPAPPATFLDRAAPGRTKQEGEAPSAPPAVPLASPAAVNARPIVAVIGLAAGCGTTTLARALAATLARRDHSGAAIVSSQAPGAASNLAVRSATRLAARVSSGGAQARAAGRLCITNADQPEALVRLAPVVLDLPPGEHPQIELAHVTVLVVPGDAEPALAELAARNLRRVGRQPLTVVTRAADPERWQQRAFLLLPASHVGARLAAAGWEARGPLGAAIARIADACEEAACE